MTGWVGAFTLATALAVPGAQDSDILTIDRAIEIALENAFSIRIAQTEITQAELRVQEQRAGLGPQIGTTATYTRFDRATKVSFGEDAITVQPIDNTRAEISATLPIDISGIRRIGIAAAGFLTEAARENLLAEVNTLKGAVRAAYLDVLRTQELVRVADDALQLRRSTLATARASFEAGVLARVDVVQAETQVAQAEGDLLQAENLLRLAKQGLNLTLGRAIDTEYELSGPWEAPQSLPTDAEALREAAWQSRAELRALEQNRFAIRRALDATKLGLAPSLNLSVVHAFNFGAGGFGARDQSTTGVAVLSIPVFDSGITRSRVKQVEQEETQVQIREEQVRLGISLEVRRALTNWQDAQARLAVARQNLALAEESLRVVTLRYREGEAIQVEVDRAQSDLTRAQIAVVTARYDVLAAHADLQRAVGTDDLTALPGGSS